MAHLGATFDPTEVPQDERSFDPMPAGDYNCQITDSEIVETKSGGEMLKLTLEVLDGPHANRKVWDNLNIRNANAQAQLIAHRTLADLCQACGIGAITDSEDLHFKPFVATLKVEPAREGNDGKTYDARNGVKRYKGRSGSAPASHPQAERSAPVNGNGAAQPGRGATGSRPWNSKPAAAAAHDDVPF